MIRHPSHENLEWTTAPQWVWVYNAQSQKIYNENLYLHDFQRFHRILDHNNRRPPRKRHRLSGKKVQY